MVAPVARPRLQQGGAVLFFASSSSALSAAPLRRLRRVGGWASTLAMTPPPPPTPGLPPPRDRPHALLARVRGRQLTVARGLLVLARGRHGARIAGEDLERHVPPLPPAPLLKDAVQGLLQLAAPPRCPRAASPPSAWRPLYVVARRRRRRACATVVLRLFVHRGTVELSLGCSHSWRCVVFCRRRPRMLQLKLMLLVVLAPVQTMTTLSVDKCLQRILKTHRATVVARMTMPGALYCSLRKDFLERHLGDAPPSVAVEVFLKMCAWHVPEHRGYSRRSRQWRRPIMTFCMCRRPNYHTARLFPWTQEQQAIGRRLGLLD